MGTSGFLGLVAGVAIGRLTTAERQLVFLELCFAPMNRNPWTRSLEADTS